jgi:hypothetical protein
MPILKGLKEDGEPEVARVEVVGRRALDREGRGGPHGRGVLIEGGTCIKID